METFYSNTEIKLGTDVAIIDQNEVIHAFASLRIKTGEKVRLINGRGSAFICEVLGCSKKELVLLPSQELSADTEYKDIKLTAAVSMLNKSSKMKLLVEKLTELGISEFIPFVSKRTAFPKMNTGSLKPSMISALKQCGGAEDVQLREPLTFEELISVEGFDKRYFADISGSGSECGIKQGKILVVTGPEGGFDENEIFEMKKRQIIPLKLNKRILRSETAAIVAASKFLY